MNEINHLWIVICACFVFFMQAGFICYEVGFVRPITIWPFAEKQMQELAGKVKGILVHELNCGQYVLEVERAVAGKVPVSLYAKYDNESATPAELLAEIKKAMA